MPKLPSRKSQSKATPMGETVVNVEWVTPNRHRFTFSTGRQVEFPRFELIGWNPKIKDGASILLPTSDGTAVQQYPNAIPSGPRVIWRARNSEYVIAEEKAKIALAKREIDLRAGEASGVAPESRIEIKTIPAPVRKYPWVVQGSEKRVTVFGHPLTSVLRWMGAEGMKLAEAQKILRQIEVDCAKGTIDAQLGAGKQGKRGPPAPLSVEQGNILYDLLG